MKYICLECEGEFDEPKKTTERHNVDSPPYEKFLVCPYCGGQYVPKHTCVHCGHTLTDVYLFVKMTGERICKDCVIEYQFGEEHE